MDVIACWEQLETEGTSLLMEKDLSRVGLAWGRRDRQIRQRLRKEERVGTSWEDTEWRGKPQDGVSNSHDA